MLDIPDLVRLDGRRRTCLSHPFQGGHLPRWAREEVPAAFGRNKCPEHVQRVEVTANPHALAFYEKVAFVHDGGELVAT